MEWISIEHKLTADDFNVLVYHGIDQHITVGSFNKDNVHYYIESNGQKFYTDSGWETEIPWAQKGDVTHWMYLPNKPEFSNGMD